MRILARLALPAWVAVGMVCRARRAGASIEFAVCGVGIFAFILGILNLGMLGFQFSALVHAVQQTGRWATVQATASLVSGNNTLSEPCLGRDVTEFNTLADPPLAPLAQPGGTISASGSQTTGNLTLAVSWTGTAGSANGIYETLTGTLHWQPVGFLEFGQGFPLEISTAASVAGSAINGVTVSGSCS